MRIATSLVLLLIARAVLAGDAISERVSTAAERDATAITIYNDDLALIKEQRRVDLAPGLNRLSLREVSGRMDPATALLRAVDGPALGLVEQNFDFDLLTPEKLLDKYVGKQVTVIRTNPATGVETREPATVLAAGQGTVLRFADRIETGVPGRLAFDSVPANLRDQPTLSTLLRAAGGPQRVELSYLSAGFGWQADYVAQLTADGKHLDLNGWVTLTNSSGTSFENAQLQLVAGAVHRAPVPVQEERPEAYAPKAMAAPAPAPPREEALMDYHLYTFERPTSIASNQTKQLALLSASGVPVTREYVLGGQPWYYQSIFGRGGPKLKPAVYVKFDNKGQLDKPLPGGVVRVYAKDSKGAAQFVGEDHIEHTARNETVKLKLGEAFDITAERVQTQYEHVSNQVFDSAWKIEIRNAKDEAVTVKVEEPMPGDWTVTRESLPHAKDSAHQASWQVTVPAGGKTVLEYAVRVK